MRTVTITNETRITVIGDRIEIANKALTRMVGLLGRPGIAPGGGLLIRPSSGVHTIGMSFPIDVIGLDKHMQVMRLWHSLVPFRVTSLSWKMQTVIELPAGRIIETGVQLGDTLRINKEELGKR
jgi:uncharacterized membrane protein (UPF0127 family)